MAGYNKLLIAYIPHAANYLRSDCLGFSYALHLPLSQLDIAATRLRDSDLVADAIDLVVDLATAAAGRFTFDHSAASLISKQVRRAQRTFQLPIIFNVKPTAATSSGSQHPRDVYLQFLRLGLRPAPEFLFVDMGLDDDSVRVIIATRGQTKVIGHYCDENPGAHGWKSKRRIDIFRRACSIGCDVVRLCQPAKSAADSISFQQFRKYIEQIHVPLITYNTGMLGRTSCFLNRIFNPVTHPLLRSLDSATASDWLITVSEA